MDIAALSPENKKDTNLWFFMANGLYRGII